ncbi:hypothetical protein [Glycomyces sp. NPDC048151]|uniref:hypothetical protein n=1 Tax=Glycomyces sp. NPDC048151 TaxID=3364002 RepID=UPI00371DBAFA
MRFTCSRFPVGEVPIRTKAGVVMFVDGTADVEGDLAAALKEVPGSFGISWEEPKKPVKKATPRSKG